MMKLYTVIVAEDPGREWHATCRVEVVGSALSGLPLGDATGIGLGKDPADAAHDAMCAAELGLPDPGVLVLRERARQPHYD